MKPAVETQTSLTHPWVACHTRVLNKVRQERKIRLVGGMGAVRYCNTHSRSSAVAKRALMERVYYVKGPNGFVKCPEPTPLGVQRLAIVTQRLIKSLPTVGPPLSDVAAVATFQGSRRKRMETARVSLLKRPLERKDFQLASFVKAEKWAKDSAPRLIQAWGPRATLRLAAYLKPVEHKVYDALNEMCGETVVFKGMNGEQRAAGIEEKWNRFTDPIAMGSDASRFDQHVSIPALDLEHSVYKSMYPGHSELRDMLLQQLASKGVIVCDDGVIHYRVSGKRCSGHINTSLGNVTLMVLMCLSYVESLGWRLGREVSLCNDGDDCVFIMESWHAKRFRAGIDAYFLAFGFEMTTEVSVRVFEQIEFCQSRPVWNGERYVMVRNPTKCVQNDLHFIDFDERMVPDVVNAVGHCGGSLYAGVPVLQAFYASLRSGKLSQRVLKDVRFQRSALYTLRTGFSAKMKPISDKARLSFWRAWDVHPETQLQLEKLYALSQPTYDYLPFKSTPGFDRELLTDTQRVVSTFLQ